MAEQIFLLKQSGLSKWLSSLILIGVVRAKSLTFSMLWHHLIPVVRLQSSTACAECRNVMPRMLLTVFVLMNLTLIKFTEHPLSVSCCFINVYSTLFTNQCRFSSYASQYAFIVLSEKQLSWPLLVHILEHSTSILVLYLNCGMHVLLSTSSIICDEYPQ